MAHDGGHTRFREGLRFRYIVLIFYLKEERRNVPLLELLVFYLFATACLADFSLYSASSASSTSSRTVVAASGENSS